MSEMHSATVNDDGLALVLAWPNVTARGDEQWYLWLKKIGIVKNLNFKVGHAAIVLIHRTTGKCYYYDFGRYITPRGFGRARSTQTDPDLSLETICTVEGWGPETVVQNIEDLLQELHLKRRYTHGDETLYGSIATGLSFIGAKKYADEQCVKGAVRYSAFDRRNNNCSRFVQRTLKEGLPADSIIRWQISWPETFVASPISNVVNARKDHQILRYTGQNPDPVILNRFASLRFFLRQVSANFFWGDYQDLRDDTHPGYQTEPSVRPASVPGHAQWLGGIGEGAWHAINRINDRTLYFRRFTLDGSIDISGELVQNKASQFSPDEPYSFTYNTNALMVSILQKEVIHQFALTSTIESTYTQEIHYAS